MFNFINNRRFMLFGLLISFACVIISVILMSVLPGALGRLFRHLHPMFGLLMVIFAGVHIKQRWKMLFPPKNITK